MAITFQGEFEVAAPRSQVYSFLADPRRFAPCLPTYHGLVMKGEKEAEVTVRVGVGKIRGNATMVLVLRDDAPARHAAYDGKGKIMGSAFNMATSFDLADTAGGGTLVQWAGELTMFGALVSLAGGLIKPLATKDIDSLVAALQAALGADGSAGLVPAGTAGVAGA